MMSELFAGLCPGGPVCSEAVWEISRLVTSPDLPRGMSVFAVHRRLAMALVEFALLNDINRYVLVTEARRVPALLSVGWDVDPISLPVEHDGSEIQALAIRVDARTLERMRTRFGVPGPVLSMAGEAMRLAS
jgi:N-acyl-L-homoserine lactone synthetase